MIRYPTSINGKYNSNWFNSPVIRQPTRNQEAICYSVEDLTPLNIETYRNNLSKALAVLESEYKTNLHVQQTYKPKVPEYLLEESANNIMNHINERLEENSFITEEFRFTKPKMIDSDRYSDTRFYKYKLVDTEGTKIDVVSQFEFLDGSWIPSEYIYDQTDELDEFFYDYKNHKVLN